MVLMTAFVLLVFSAAWCRDG